MTTRDIKLLYAKRIPNEQIPEKFSTAPAKTMIPEEFAAMKSFLAHYGLSKYEPFYHDTVKVTYLTKAKAVVVVDCTHPGRALTAGWHSVVGYFRARNKYLGIPSCCTEHVIDLPEKKRMEPIPFYFARCPKHAALSAEAWCELVNKTRVYPEKLTATSGLPSSSKIFFRVAMYAINSR